MTHGRKYGDKESRPIPIWNGILEHRERIGSAIWVFIWFLDKITEEKDGLGIVLGRAPVRMARIAEDLALEERVVRHRCQDLETAGYIRRTRTPYGYVVKVLNSRKFEIWHPQRSDKNVRSVPERSDEKDREIGQKYPEGSDKNVRNKEDAARNAANAAVPGFPLHPIWEALRILPLAVSAFPPAFRELCEGLWTGRDDAPLHDFMGTCMDRWQAQRGKIPPAFAKAKAALASARNKVSPETGLPELPDDVLM